MPALSRMYIKIGLIYFAAALVIGAALGLQPVLGLPPEIIALRPVYWHGLMVGWVMQLIFGVVYWMFPKQSKEHPRGSEKLGWAVFGLLNTGLLLRVIFEPLAAVRPDLGIGWLLALSAVLQLLAGWGFVANTWGRVKER